MKKKWFLLILIAPIAIGAIVGIGGGLVMALWNWLMPPLFGLPAVTFWQAFGLLALCRILFGGPGFHGRHPRRGPEHREHVRRVIRRRLGIDDDGEPGLDDARPARPIES